MFGIIELWGTDSGLKALKPSYFELWATPFQSVGISDAKLEFFVDCNYGKWGLYSYVFWDEESIATTNFRLSQPYNHFWATPFFHTLQF